MRKLAIVLEYTWLVISICCVFTGIHATVKFGFNVSYMFFILSVVAAMMFYIRRRRRMAAEKQRGEQ